MKALNCWAPARNSTLWIKHSISFKKSIFYVYKIRLLVLGSRNKVIMSTVYHIYFLSVGEHSAMRMYFFLSPVAFVFCVATCTFLGLWVKKPRETSQEDIELQERNLHGNAALQHNNPLYFLGRTITYRKLHVSE